MEEFEEFKRTILRIVNYRDEIPQEVLNNIEQIFRQVQEIYENYGCINSSMIEGIEIEVDAVKRIINTRIADDRRNEHFEELMMITNKMETHIQDIENSANTIQEDELQEIKDKRNSQFREEVSLIGSNNRRIVNKIMDLVEEHLRDVRSRQGRILYNMGQLGDNQIEEIQYEVLDVIRRFQHKEDEMMMIFENDEQILRDEILRQYDNYIEQTQSNEAKKFRDSLNAGISLKEQADLAKQLTDEQKGSEENKPKLLVDELPDLLL